MGFVVFLERYWPTQMCLTPGIQTCQKGLPSKILELLGPTSHLLITCNTQSITEKEKQMTSLYPAFVWCREVPGEMDSSFPP